MLQVLTHDILPVFSLLALGFVMGRMGSASEAEARAANRIAFLILQPALIFPLTAQIDWSVFRFDALGIYALTQAIMLAVGYFIARQIFGRGRREAMLLGMTLIFVNSLLYIWPISILIYGAAEVTPVTAIVAWDSAVTFAFFILAMELMSGRGAAATVGRISANPVLVGIALGVVVNLAGIPLPAPLLTATDFAGVAAAPLTLFAVGVILSHQPLRPTAPVVTLSALKLLGFPALLWALMSLLSPGNTWTAQFLLNGAGPSGTMAFSLAMLYKVPTETITAIVIWTSVLSLVSLALLA